MHQSASEEEVTVGEREEEERRCEEEEAGDRDVGTKHTSSAAAVPT